uniref:Nucleoporin_N domain-containing protein n=1 Tax=Panagrellus redivivus TaxID=6233 RepID=A0A7E4VAX3_PANRE
MAANTTTFEAPTKSTDIGSFFVSANKVFFTSYGPSRLLAFDQVNAYIIAVEKGSEPVYTCLSVIALEPLPGDDIEIDSIAINHDFTRAALIGRKNVYAFVIPNPRGQVGVLRVAISGHMRLIASFLIIGPLPHVHTRQKPSSWLPVAIRRLPMSLVSCIRTTSFESTTSSTLRRRSVSVSVRPSSPVPRRTSTKLKTNALLTPHLSGCPKRSFRSTLAFFSMKRVLSSPSSRSTTILSFTMVVLRCSVASLQRITSRAHFPSKEAAVPWNRWTLPSSNTRTPIPSLCSPWPSTMAPLPILVDSSISAGTPF